MAPLPALVQLDSLVMARTALMWTNAVLALGQQPRHSVQTIAIVWTPLEHICVNASKVMRKMPLTVAVEILTSVNVARTTVTKQVESAQTPLVRLPAAAARDSVGMELRAVTMMNVLATLTHATPWQTAATLMAHTSATVAWDILVTDLCAQTLTNVTVQRPIPVLLMLHVVTS